MKVSLIVKEIQMLSIGIEAVIAVTGPSTAMVTSSARSQYSLFSKEAHIK